MPARPPWMAEVLETQEQFPVKAGIQECLFKLLDSGDPHGCGKLEQRRSSCRFCRNDEKGVIARSRRRLRGEAEANSEPMARNWIPRFARNRLRNLQAC